MGYHHIVSHQIDEILSKQLNQLISHNDTHTIIDLAKIIYIKEHHCYRLVFFPGTAHKFSQKPHKIIAIIEPCQNIIISHVRQFIILCVELCHIFKAYNLICGPAIIIIDNIDFHFYADTVLFQPDLNRLAFYTLLLYK